MRSSVYLTAAVALSLSLPHSYLLTPLASHSLSHGVSESVVRGSWSERARERETLGGKKGLKNRGSLEGDKAGCKLLRRQGMMLL